MNFRKKSEYHGISEDGRYVIARANGAGYASYTAARNNSDPDILACVRFATDEERSAAWQKCVAACVADQAARE